MRIRFTIIASLLLPILVNAQAFQIDKPALPIDSLKKLLPLLLDSARVDCLNELSRSYREAGTLRHFDTAWLFAKQAYSEASAINHLRGLGDACLLFGHLAQWHHWNSSEMEKRFREAISWYKKRKLMRG